MYGYKGKFNNLNLVLDTSVKDGYRIGTVRDNKLNNGNLSNVYVKAIHDSGEMIR